MKFTDRLKICFVFMLFPMITYAEVIINGTVTDEEEEPLPGVSIVLKGTAQGTVTDLDGNFSIKTPSEESFLIFSFLGYTTQEIRCAISNPLIVKLKQDDMILDDVVVVGYGTQQKRDLTGAIQSLKSPELVKAMNVNVTESLNGRVAGVLVTKTSNRPGANMSMEIRGLNSINSSNEPLYVIDGIPSYSGMKFLNVSDIESIDVLKDASSCAIYGSRGANGVVIVTTKGANKTNGFSIEYDGTEGIKIPTRIPDMIGNKGNGMEYVDYRTSLWKKIYGNASLSRSDFLTDAERKRIRNGEYYDWLRELSQNGSVSSHSINSTGSTENTSYTLGISYLNEEGLIDNESFRRITANAGIEHRVSKHIKSGFNAYLSKNNNNQGSTNALLNAYFIPPIESPWDEDGNLLLNCQPTSSKINPLMQIQNDIQKSESYYVNTSSYVEYSPIKDLSIKSLISYQFDTSLSGEYVGADTQENGGVNPAYATRSESRNSNWVWDNTINYKKRFNDVHRIEMTGLFSMQKDEHLGSGITAIDLPYESAWHAIETAAEITNPSSYYWASSMLSYMFRVNYALYDKYLITATGRYDGTSRLAEGKQWGFMPSLALAWQLKQEAFLQNFDPLDNLKLRISYGKTGNNNLAYDVSISKLALSKYSFDSGGSNGFGLSGGKGNPDLEWEMTSEYNIGTDFGFFKNRISGSIDIYNRKTEGLIFNRSISAVNGYGSVYQNIGTTSNKGIEWTLNTINIETKNFQWKSGITFSLNRNKILDLYGDQKDDLGNRWFIGQPVNVVYDYKQTGIWQEDEAEEAAVYGQLPGQIKVMDIDNNGKIDANDMQIVGVRSPDWTAGFNTSFTYRNFDLYIDMYARVGGLYNDEFTYMFTGWDNEHWNKLNVEYWTPENRTNHYPQAGAQSYYTQVLSQTSGSFLKIRNITLGYNLNGNRKLKQWGVRSIRLYATVQNPFTFTNYIGSDPEIIGEDVYTQLSLYPMTFSMGLKLTF